MSKPITTDEGWDFVNKVLQAVADREAAGQTFDPSRQRLSLVHAPRCKSRTGGACTCKPRLRVSAA